MIASLIVYCVNKFVGFFLSPLGLVFVLLALAAVAALRRWRRLAWICGGAAVAALYFFSTGAATRLIGPPLEREFLPSSPAVACGTIETVPDAEMICVLGGGMAHHERCGAYDMNANADRVWQGVKLWKAMTDAGREAVRISVSGGGVATSTVPFMVECGVPEGVFVSFPDARITEDEAQMIAASGVTHVALVTSAWHMRRSRMLFERAGLKVTPVAADFEMTMVAEAAWRFRDFLPTADALARNSIAVKEWVGLVGYTLFR